MCVCVTGLTVYISGVTRIFTQGAGGTTNMFTKAGIHHRNVYMKKCDKLAHLITHKIAWSFQRQTSVISIKTVNNIPLPIIGVWEKIIYYARRNWQIFLYTFPSSGGGCPSAP